MSHPVLLKQRSLTRWRPEDRRQSHHLHTLPLRSPPPDVCCPEVPSRPQGSRQRLPHSRCWRDQRLGRPSAPRKQHHQNLLSVAKVTETIKKEKKTKKCLVLKSTFGRWRRRHLAQCQHLHGWHPRPFRPLRQSPRLHSHHLHSTHLPLSKFDCSAQGQLWWSRPQCYIPQMRH